MGERGEIGRGTAGGVGGDDKLKPKKMRGRGGERGGGSRGAGGRRGCAR